MNAKKYFIDSNLLVYAIDERDIMKKEKAQRILERLIKNNEGVISTQSLEEFYNVITKKLKIHKQDAKVLVEDLIKTFPVQEISPQTILSAIEISINTQFSFWDSLVLETARQSECEVFYSEDLNNGQVVCGVEIINPFY